MWAKRLLDDNLGEENLRDFEIISLFQLYTQLLNTYRSYFLYSLSNNLKITYSFTYSLKIIQDHQF